MLNRVVLTGRLTKDPTLRYTPNGVAVCSFTLAVDSTYKKQNGEKETDFINIVVWKTQGENAANYLKKGSLAGVDGKLKTRNYEGQNGRVYVTEVVAESVQFLEPKSSQGQGDTNTQQRQQTQNNSQPDPFKNSRTVEYDDIDSQLPF